MTMHKYMRKKMSAPKTEAPKPVGGDSLVKQTDYSVDAPGPPGDENRPPKTTAKK
jgi:hypothetical protein